MREILFRAKSTITKKWLIGYFYRPDILSYVFLEEFYADEYIIPETLGQYTGLKDKNGTKIFEGDVVSYNGALYKVVFEDRNLSAYFGIAISAIETWQFSYQVPSDHMEVVGNIYDNPELLEEVK